MARNYYSLVAGLREFSLDSDNKGFDAKALIEEIRGELGKEDRGYLELFYNYYDIGNIINLNAGRAQFSELGNFSREQLAEEIQNPAELPDFISAVLAAYREPDNPEFDETDRTKTFEKSLFEAFYAGCDRSGSKFIREWFGFDRNLRNVMAAYTAKRLSVPVTGELVGDGYVVDMLTRSSAADFGLKGELDYIDEVISALNDESNLLEKERRLDNIRWRMSDELTVFDYFNMHAVLAYLVKVNLAYRWISLDPAYGREMFRKLMASFEGSKAIGEAESENGK